MAGPDARLPPTLVVRGLRSSSYPSAVRGAWLSPLSSLYAAVVKARRRWWRDRGIALPCPVVSVGNLTCGGTGKTPTVEMVARDLVEMGQLPAILSRGYRALAGPGSDHHGGESAPQGGNDAGFRAGLGEETPAVQPAVNDEFLVLADNLPGVRHYQGRDRVASGRAAIRDGAEVLVLDDGFQHLRLQRDLDIVLVDALRPFDNGRVLPAGLLREPLEALARAHLVAIARTELVAHSLLCELALFLARRFPRLPQILLETRPISWEDLDRRVLEPDALRGEPVLAFCGIGNPEAFRGQLRSLGLVLREWVPFRDHHRYSVADVQRLARRASDVGAASVVMTQKDAVKLRDRRLSAATGALPWRYLKIRQNVRAGEHVYREMLEQVSSRLPRPG